MQRGGAVALTSDEVQQQRTYRLLTDEEVIAALLEHPGTSATVLARLFHAPGRAVDWHAMKAQLVRLVSEGRVRTVTNGTRRKWTGWEASDE